MSAKGGKARASLKVSANLSEVNTLRSKIERAEAENQKLREQLTDLGGIERKDNERPRRHFDNEIDVHGELQNLHAASSAPQQSFQALTTPCKIVGAWVLVAFWLMFGSYVLKTMEYQVEYDQAFESQDDLIVANASMTPAEYDQVDELMTYR